MKTAYPQVMGTCDITLYANIPFDNSYQHHCLVSDRFKYNSLDIFQTSSGYTNPACERFIDRRDYKVAGMPYVYKRWTLTGDYNFNFSNGLIASLTLELTPAQTNANYLKLVCGSDIYYYFITGISQVNFDTYNLSLELDVIMTYQDEFLDGMKDVPVLTQRKMCHRYTNDGLTPHCADYKTGDSAFTGVKPSIVDDTIQTYLSGELDDLKTIQWLYICVDADVGSSGVTPPFDVDTYYKYDKTIHPLSMMVVPIGMNDLIFSDGTNTVTLTGSTFINVIHSLVGSGVFHACKLSPYPPFKSNTMTITKDASNNYTIRDTPAKMVIQDDGSGNHKVVMYTNSKTKIYAGGLAPANYLPTILEEYRSDFQTSPFSLGFNNDYAPTITSTRYKDPKLLFEPFRKYTISATYGDDFEFYPELVYSDGVYLDDEFYLSTIYTCYIGDFNISTYLNPVADDNGYDFFKSYKDLNIGLSCNVNYNLPVGQDALASFNLTQSQTFYQSKIASGITSGVTIAGGIGSIALGVASENPLLIGAGATAIAGGVASGVNAIKSTTAKIEDLKNTPDSINVQGSCYVNDFARRSYLMPFITQYIVSNVILNNADDYFYEFGYQVSRDCYFNTELQFDNDVSYNIDDNLFNRTIFNYIQINEDITNKINANIPYVIKKKLSQVFNQGITLWTFFGFSQIYLIYPPQDYDPDYTYDIDKWFMKHKYDNTEYDGSEYY